ncbi:PaaI family thioesterase [Deinococcus koreensis]|uniref:Medium/long-chain acyl-CoA thioesterase YigI n=1 Tax=Deinococcus koreensis TaxID=2054903 RepID=A0A2K3UWX4_9DEIO|nr:PaaI family thioesterase [Deinococcus koreensis]PNY81042.1 hypothetical protein CVO96_06325 [Deinococcus koreensis]
MTEARMAVQQALFDRQGLMRTLGAQVVHASPGEVHVRVPLTDATTQHDDFMHAGAFTAVMDSACGAAALGLWDDAVGVLTSEFKVNFLRPARGDVTARGRVLKSGRTQTVCIAEAWATGRGGADELIAVMTATMVPVRPR